MLKLVIQIAKRLNYSLYVMCFCFCRFCRVVFPPSRGAGPLSPPIGLNGVADRVAVQDMKFAVMADLGCGHYYPRGT